VGSVGGAALHKALDMKRSVSIPPHSPHTPHTPHSSHTSHPSHPSHTSHPMSEKFGLARFGLTGSVDELD
jgi:hypothetical protein